MTRLVARFPATWPLMRAPMRRFFDRAAGDWDNRTAGAERLRPLEEALKMAGAEPRRALDLGTGTGAAAIWLAERFPQASVAGVDVAPAMVEQARARVPATLAERLSFEVADASALPFADGEFDLVVQVSVPVFPAETARVLASGGVFVAVSSIGAATPFHTPLSLLRRGFERQGLEWVGRGAAGAGLYCVVRKP